MTRICCTALSLTALSFAAAAKSVASSLWRDDAGFVLSSEAVLVSTVAILGATAGFSAVSHSVNEELVDVSKALRSLDQSYTIPGRSSCGASTAGSCFRQQDVDESLAEIDLIIAEHEAHEHEHDQADRDGKDADRNRMTPDTDDRPAQPKKPKKKGNRPQEE